MAIAAGSIRCARPLLLAVVDGVAPMDLADAAAAAGLPVTACLPLRPLPAPTGLDAAIAALRPANPLRELGLAVDQRGLCLRPAWRSDDAQLQLLRRRPSGLPAVTLLALREVLLQAALHGPGSQGHGDALARLPQQLTAASDLLRDGDAPEVWLLATGRAMPVQRTFPLATVLRQRHGWPFARLQIAVLPELARIRSGSERERQRLAALLQQEPFARLGRCLDSGRAGETWFLAADGVAFGERPWRGRRALDASAGALLPVPVRTANELDLAGLVGRFCLRAVELLQEPAPQPRRPRAVDLPDLAAALAPAPVIAG